MKLNIGRKLGLGFGLIVVLLIFGAVTAVVNVNRTNAIVDQLIGEAESGEALDEFGFSLSEAYRWAVGYTIIGEAGGAEEMEEALAEADENFEILLLSVEEDEQAQVQELGLALETSRSMFADTVTAYNRDPENMALTIRNLEEIDEYLDEALTPVLEEFDAHEDAELEGFAEEATSLGASAFVTSVTLGLVATVVSIAAAYTISRGITGSASHLSGAADAISRGDMDVPIRVATGDEMQTLAEAVDRMRLSLKAAIVRLR